MLLLQVRTVLLFILYKDVLFEVIGSLWSLFEGTFEIFFISANFSNIQVDKDSSEKTMPWISFKLKSNGAFLKIFFLFLFLLHMSYHNTSILFQILNVKLSIV